jgi:hypothetical protein
VGKPEGYGSLERPGHKWEGDIKMDIKDIRMGERGLD